MINPIIITVDVTPKELKRFIKRIYLKNFKFLKYFLYFGIPLILLNTYNMLQQDSEVSAFIPIFAFFSVLFLGWQFFLHKATTTAYQQKKDDFDHSIYTFSEDYLGIQASSGESKLNWSGFIKVEENADFILLYSTPIQAYILPKRCFPDNETIQIVFEFSKEKIGS